MINNVVVVGATGVVGRLTLEIMSERNFPAKNIIALASKNSVGKKVKYGNKGNRR